MKMTRYLGASIAIFISLLVTNVQGNTNEVEPLIQEARLKANAGDLEQAALLYHEVLQLDKNNRVAMRELSKLLIEAQSREPDADQSDLVTKIQDKAAERVSPN